MPFIDWTLVFGLAVGSFAAVVVGRLTASPARGFLGFMALCAGLFGCLAVIVDAGLPGPTSVVGSRLVAAFEAPRHWLVLAFTGLAFVYLAVAAIGRRAVGLALLTLGVGVAALVVAAFGWGGGVLDGVPLALQLVTLALATGGAFAVLVLGHWHLLLGHLPETSLVTFVRLLLAIVVVQVALFVAWLTVGVGSGRSPIDPLIGSWAPLVWLRLLVGLVVPLVVSWAALGAARARSIGAATRLLYVDAGTIAAGTLLAAGLYFGAGLLV